MDEAKSVQNSGFNIPYELREVEGKGIGVFAVTHIAKGTRMWTYTPGKNVKVCKGETACREKLDSMSSDNDRRDWIEHMFFTHGDCANEILDDGKYWNHSESPNTVTIDGCAFALHDIEAGTELLDDYGTYSYPGWYEKFKSDYGVLEDYFLIKSYEPANFN